MIIGLIFAAMFGHYNIYGPHFTKQTSFLRFLCCPKSKFYVDKISQKTLCQVLRATMPEHRRLQRFVPVFGNRVQILSQAHSKVPDPSTRVGRSMHAYLVNPVDWVDHERKMIIAVVSLQNIPVRIRMYIHTFNGAIQLVISFHDKRMSRQSDLWHFQKKLNFTKKLRDSSKYRQCNYPSHLT